MKIAIIGASSFLGKTLLQELTDSPYKLSLFSRENIFNDMDNTEWICYNYPSQLLNYNNLTGYDIIYYCAGAGIQPKHEDNNQQIYELNAFEPIRLASNLKDANYQGKLITFGSYFEIGNHSEERSYSESELATHTNPLPNAYCTAKNLLTRFIHTELRQPSKLPYSLQHFVLTNIYGAAENSNRLIHYIIQSSIKGEALSFTAGVQQRQYTHIRDITGFLFQSIEDKQSGIFNITNDAVISVREMTKKVLAVLKKELNIIPAVTFGTVDKRDVSMKYLAINTSHVQKCFTFVPKVSLEEGIKEYLKLT
jgi:nucleoside-diphosphate-sugar epimerase